LLLKSQNVLKWLFCNKSTWQR